MGRFDGRVALVTGASRGIGFAVAARLVSEGARVVITARKEGPLAEAVERLGGREHALAVPGTADDPQHRRDSVARTLETFGRLDMLVNNTGINPVYGRLVDLDLVAARKIVEVNCLAALGWVQEAYHAWFHEHGGAVVNISSISAVSTAPGIGMYAASKAMLAHLTEELAIELAPHVRVNAVAPAVVRTRFAAALYEGREDEVSARYPLRRLGNPPDIAASVAHLLSDDAAWVTGQLHVLDGGLSLVGAV